MIELPDRARVLHIGLAKTGTTALQHSAAAARATLLEHGVRYPGHSGNHRVAVSALMSQEPGWIGHGSFRPPLQTWKSLIREIEHERQRKILISHEFASEALDEAAQRFVDELGPRTQIVITLRGFAELLGSSWQQYVKSGFRQPYETWLRRIFSDPPDLRGTRSFYRRNDQAAIVDRWARIAGPERVTVIIADKRKPNLLTDSFEQLLGLPHGILRPSPDGLAANRSLSLPEVELLRQVNRQLHDRGINWSHYAKLVRGGAVARLQLSRTPAADEPRLVLPSWAAAEALYRGRHFAEVIDATGVRVVGELSTLYAEVPTAAKTEAPTQVPISIAAEAVAGVVSAATGQGPTLEVDISGVGWPLDRLTSVSTREAWMRAVHSTSALSAKDLAIALAARGLVNLRARRG